MMQLMRSDRIALVLMRHASGESVSDIARKMRLMHDTVQQVVDGDYPPKSFYSGTSEYYTLNGETKTLREWARLWLARFKRVYNPTSDTLRNAVRTLKRRMECVSFEEAINTSHRKQIRTGDKKLSGYSCIRKRVTSRRSLAIRAKLAADPWPKQALHCWSVLTAMLDRRV